MSRTTNRKLAEAAYRELRSNRMADRREGVATPSGPYKPFSVAKVNGVQPSGKSESRQQQDKLRRQAEWAAKQVSSTP